MLKCGNKIEKDVGPGNIGQVKGTVSSNKQKLITNRKIIIPIKDVSGTESYQTYELLSNDNFVAFE